MNTATGKLLDLGIKFGAKAGDTVTIELPSGFSGTCQILEHFPLIKGCGLILPILKAARTVALHLTQDGFPQAYEAEIAFQAARLIIEKTEGLE